jgi:hypothetical protein
MSEFGKLHQRQNLENPGTKWGGAEVKALKRMFGRLQKSKNKKKALTLRKNVSVHKHIGGSFSSPSLENYQCPSHCKIIPQ